MAKIKRIVTSQVESRVTSDNNEPSAYSYTSEGTITFHDENSQGRPFIGPGVFYGANEDSADQSGLNTIKLIPNDELDTDQYLIVEPTAPNHIHIRAGGQQDNSSANLILGGERTHVQISDSSGSVYVVSKQPDSINSYLNQNYESTSTFVTTNDAITDPNGFAIIDGIEYPVINVQYDFPSVGQKSFEISGGTFVGQQTYTFRVPNNENYWSFSNNGYLNGPAMGGLLVSGIYNGENDLWLSSDDNVVLNGNNGGEFLGDINNPNNQIATIGDISTSSTTSFQSVRYTPTFTATGLTFTGSDNTYPTYNSYYVKQGQLVSFVIEVDLSTVTNFGTGQYKLQLPFTPAFGFNHFSGWAWADPDVSPDTGTGHTIINADTAGVTDILDLHYLKSAGGANTPIREGLFIQGTPVTLTTISKIYVNGTYIAAS